jgi:hypothetical protein
MITSLLVGIGCMFFVLGHSTLLFFKGKDSQLIPIKQAIFPWPRKGKSVSILCLALSATSFFLNSYLAPEAQSAFSHSAWKILIVFAAAPSVIYAAYFLRRIRKTPNGLFFSPSESTEREWLAPLLISVFVSLVFLII